MLSLVKMCAAVFEKKIFKSRECNFTILQLSPLGKRNGPTFELNKLYPFSQECFVPSLVKIGLVVLDKKSKIGKVYRQT